jgi:two-component system OmpR family response regulator
MRLLVVEDDPGMSAMLVRSLQREGYAIDAVDTGEDALWSVLENDYDTVVLDAMIPVLDGFEVCRRMRAEGRWHRSSC